MGSVSYALSASMYFGLYFFIFLIAAIANRVSNLGPLWAAKWSINLCQHRFKYGFLRSFFFFFFRLTGWDMTLINF